MPHKNLLAQLLPPASYSPTAPRIAASLATEGALLDRVLANSALALGALSPFKYPQWIPDWERVYALPGTCARPDQLLQERIQLLALAFTERGGISREWLIRYAALGGYTITIQEYQPFKAGISKAGNALTNGPWRYTFRVIAHGDVVRVFKAGQSPAGEALRTWGDSILECIINKYKPAHAVVLYSYQETNHAPH